MLIRDRLTSALSRAIDRAREAGELEAAALPLLQLDVPPPGLGDFSSDVALTLARQNRSEPGRLAEILARHLEAPADLVDRVEVAKSGFLNFHLRPGWAEEQIREALRQPDRFGRSDAESACSYLVEFVSAHPTGPLTAGHGRGAAFGDALATVLEWNGARVSREFYVNDAGTHIERFARSVDARYLQAAGRAEARVPPDGFPGQYLAELGRQLRASLGDDLLTRSPAERQAILGRAGRDAMVAGQRETLERLGVRFDAWISEAELVEGGAVRALCDRLRAEDLAYEQDGALWLRSTRFGDEVDRPLVRSNGRPSYLAADLAYHLGKFERGFDRAIDIWAADHAAYAGRTRAGLQAAGGDPDRVEVLIFEPVSLKIDGLLVEAGGYAGNIHALSEVLEAAGKDTARFFYLLRPAASPLVLDLDLARSAAPENPAWGVRWALANADETVQAAGIPPAELGEARLGALENRQETELLRRLAAFPDEIRSAAREREPARLVRYAEAVASDFDAARRHEAPGPEPAARVALAATCGVVLRNALAALGIDFTPE